MRIAESVTFAGASNDRAAWLRGDAAAIARYLGDPATRVLPIWRGKPMICDAGAGFLPATHPFLTATGDLESIPERARAALQGGIDRLAGNSALTLNLALAYGGRAEIVRAARRAAERVARGEITPDQVDEDELRAGLDSPDLPDPDLVIRTSGEHRLSNFLIWQSAYAEMVYQEKLFPDFDRRDLWAACLEYAKRDRRFGSA